MSSVQGAGVRGKVTVGKYCKKQCVYVCGVCIVWCVCALHVCAYMCGVCSYACVVHMCICM